jgi:hypothetical protein
MDFEQSPKELMDEAFNLVNDWNGDAELVNLLNGKAIMISGWIDSEEIKPHEEQLCKILIKFTFPTVEGSDVELIDKFDIFESIYRSGTWIITKGNIPTGYVNTKVTKWRALNNN